MQHVLVCTDDPVLAKRVRFLLARDECEVKIVDEPELENTAEQGAFDLMIVSRALTEAQGFGRVQARIPSTMVLGGDPDITSPLGVHVVPDASDAQAIYGLASQILNPDAPPAEEEPKTEHAMRIRPDTRIESNALDTMVEHDDAEGPATAVTSHDGIDPGELAKIVFKTHAQGSSGVLIIERPDEALRLEFEAGAPVRLQSSIPGDRFGRNLVERGRLQENQYAEGAKRAIEQGMELGNALVDTHAMSREQLEAERAEYARLRIVDCFEPVTGRFRYERGGQVQDPERTFALDILPVVAAGFKRFASNEVVQRIVGDRTERYFKVRTHAAEVGEQFVLTPEEVEFLEFGGRAYNVADAAEMSGVSLEDAHKLLALLWTCEKVEDFTPGIEEFEARIREERQRSKELEARSTDLPSFASGAPASIPPPVPAPIPEPVEPPPSMPAPDDEPMPLASGNGIPGVTRPEPPAFPPPPASTAASGPPVPPAPESGPSSHLNQPSAPPPPPPPAEDVPAMPVPGPGQDGVMPQPMVYANPLPRGPDGALMDTPERTQSREHFQRGVQLLGQGQFDTAESAFREAVALCSEEHVYLVGLARAIFYNPAYQPRGKIPLLRSIVDRAEVLARDDKRVQTLRHWVAAAERDHA